MTEMVDYGHKEAAAKTKTRKILISPLNGIAYRKAAAMAVFRQSQRFRRNHLPPDFP